MLFASSLTLLAVSLACFIAAGVILVAMRGRL